MLVTADDALAARGWNAGIDEADEVPRNGGTVGGWPVFEALGAGESTCERRDGGRPRVPKLIEVFVFVLLVGKVEEKVYHLLPSV